MAAPNPITMARASGGELFRAPPRGNGWLTNHPAKSFPAEHRLGERLHQVAILQGIPNEAGTLENANASGALTAVEVGRTDRTLASSVAVGVSLDGDRPAEAVEGIALPQFSGSGMTLEHHRPHTSAVDMESLNMGADGLAHAFFEAYSHLYHRVPRFRYPAESMPPSDTAMKSAHDDHTALVAASSLAYKMRLRALDDSDDISMPVEVKPAASNASTPSVALKKLGCVIRPLGPPIAHVVLLPVSAEVPAVLHVCRPRMAACLLACASLRGSEI